MKKGGRRTVGVGAVIGAVLVIASVGILVASQVAEHRYADNAKVLVSELRSLMPEIKSGVPDDRVNTAMPMLEVDGENFVGILEIPLYETALPIYAAWDTAAVSAYPCRYTGSMYDGSLIIGGKDADGQLSCMRTISDGDAVYITDVTGIRYTYTVTSVLKTKDVSTENLTAENAELVLFVRNAYALDYTVVRCALYASRYT